MRLLFIILTVIFQDMPNITIHQDSAIIRLLDEKVNGTNSDLVETDGYRIQIYSSNQQQQAKSEAMLLERTMSEQISEKVYITYATPFWKVRVGDYRTIEEAQRGKEELIQRFPELQSSTYVVRDKIKVKE